MSFFKRTQKELDDAFLKAVGEFKFSKAKKLLKKGASVQARDADGNTAFHLTAKNNPESGDCDRELFGPNYYIADDFICFLLNQKLDINAVNKYGKNCLHFSAANEDDYEGKIIAILLNRGANPKAADNAGKTPLHHVAFARSATRLIENGAQVGAQDKTGKTPLHVAAANGEDTLVQLFLKTDMSSVAIKDRDGKYAHESAVAGLAGHYMLSRVLLDHLNLHYRAVAEAEKRKEQEKAAAALLKDGWLLLEPEKVAHVDVQKSLGYKLTEIFNFHARTYTVITQNIETKSEMTIVKSFDDFTDPTLLKDGYRQLIRLGGKAEESIIYKKILNKGQSKLPRLGPD
jgi:ankyrin repeat protein